MTLYIVYDHIRYEGCSPPLAAFSTRESAMAFIEKAKAEDDTGDKSWSIAELTVDSYRDDPRPSEVIARDGWPADQ